MSKHTILFLAANPLGADRLALADEARAIQLELERSGQRDRFELVTRWAVQPMDLLRELRRLKPTIVHFSGHGRGHGHETTAPGDERCRDALGTVDRAHGAPHGLVFESADGRPQLVSTTALVQTFGAAGASVRVVVLNACYSEAHAAALTRQVGCVVGMPGAIRDIAAQIFAVGFYGGLGEREPVAAAYRQGWAALELHGLVDRERPQLKVRAGLDAEQLVIA